MVSKIKPMMTRRRSALDLKKGRPKRNVSPKNLEDSVSGLSWKEERELKKALYASLQEARRQSRDGKPEGTLDDTCIKQESQEKEVTPIKKSQSLPILRDPRFFDESSCSQDSNRSFVSKDSEKAAEVKKRKIHAQRKFAQGYVPSAYCETQSKPKVKASPVKLFPVRPTTEDFLTYLCFRGTHLLPPHLDLMNVKKDDYSSGMPLANGKPGSTRDSSPASSSSMSHNNEDSMDVTDMPQTQTPNKKAARASASTPQTARGFANLRQRLSDKGSPLAKGKSSSLPSRNSRKRLSDSYHSLQHMKKTPHRGSVSDRLSLKRKAMATLTAAKMGSTSRQARLDGRLRATVSDGALLKRKGHESSRSRGSTGRNDVRNVSPEKTDHSRKRQLPRELAEKYVMTPTTKRQKLRTSKRVESILKSKARERAKLSSKTRMAGTLETHPKKRLGTSVKVKTYKPQRPMTRACTHLKSVLKAAKKAANNKMRLLKKMGKVPASGSTTKSSSVMRASEAKQRSGTSERKKLFSDNSTHNTSFGSDTSGEIRIKTEQFPLDGEPAAVVQCPTYYPSEEQFKDPILYIQSIQQEAEVYGMCKVVPPCNWKMESRELEDMRFTTQIQYIHKMQHKWSPLTEQLEYIKRLYESEGTEKFTVPQIGGVDVDLVRLYELVQKYGGMKGTVGKEKKWMKIADSMKIPKQADRVSKLYAAYCKFLLAYETLSEEETDKLVETVQAEKHRQERESGRTLPPLYKCVLKGKSRPLSAFNRAARNTEALYLKESCDSPEEIEAGYWDVVRKADDHVAVQTASLDTSVYGSMFPVRRDNPYARHGWNLHNLMESKGSILHHLGLIAGVTVPTLHISMLYTTKCLSCNSHNLPTVQYLHQGPGLIWYSVPAQEASGLKSAVRQLVPNYIRDKGIPIQPNSLMVDPAQLIEKGVPMSRCVQSPREFVVVFPRATYCNISMGYNLSESVHFATKDWIPHGYQAAKDLEANHDVEYFSMDAMLVFLAQDHTTSESTLAILCPYLENVVEREIAERKKLFEAGLRESERLLDKVSKHAQKSEVLEEIIICDTSNKICYLSMVLNSHENSAFSLQQGLLHIQKKKNIKHCKLMYRYSEEELISLVRTVKSKIKVNEGPASSGSSPKRKGLRNSDPKSSPTVK